MAFFDKFKKSKPQEEAKEMAKLDEVLRALDELSEDEKNSISHRGKAFISMAEFVKKQLKK